MALFNTVMPTVVSGILFWFTLKLLTDEATSALDKKTQTIVRESLDRLKATCIVIAHRLITIRNDDRIFVLHGGRVEQEGSFEELANTQGIFANLMQRQMT